MYCGRLFRYFGWLGVVTAAVFCVSDHGAADEPKLSNGEALSPKDEQATFRVPKGFHVELVACEPQVVDPVAIAFDEEGRLFVAEMRGYPNAGVATGMIDSGKVKMLEDRDGDGFYEHSTTFAEKLRFPTSVMPWKGGLLVSVAPDISYFEDTKGTGQADRQRTIYTGFGLENIQQLINALQWGMDNWVYGCAGLNVSKVSSPDDPSMPTLTLRNRGVRFHPEKPASLEATSSGGQFGLVPDDWGHWFTNTNSQHLRHIVLPDHYLRRNPSLPVKEVTLDIPDHGAACQVQRISPFEAWRVERTRRRREGPTPTRYPSTELIPGGYITSACSPLIYNGGLFPEQFYGNSFICDPANNLIHRDLLKDHGATYVAERADQKSEFMASTDNWFRPVNLAIGPDGAIYVVDFYREVIETPISLPEDIKKRVNLQSRGRGRIWRIVPDGTKRPAKPSLRQAPVEELVQHLADTNSWWRFTCQRLLIERQDKSVVKAIAQLARETKFAPGRAHALWTLHGLNALDDDLVELALKDSDAGVREQGLRLAEDRLASSERLRAVLLSLGDDPSPKVRFQLAFSLGEMPDKSVRPTDALMPDKSVRPTVAVLAKIARRDLEDPWTQIAVLTSAGKIAPALLETLVREKEFTASTPSANQFLTRLAALVGAGANDETLARVFHLLQAPVDRTLLSGTPPAWQIAILDGLGEGLQNNKKALNGLWSDPPAALKEPLETLRPYFARAAASAGNEKVSLRERKESAHLLGYGPFATAAPVLEGLLAPTNPAELQMAGVRALSLHDHPDVAKMLLAPWVSFSPVVRREVLETLFARSNRLGSLLDAIEQKKILPGQLEPARLEQLRGHSNPNIRKRAQTLLAGQGTPDRRKVLEDYQAALELQAEVTRGKAVFKKTCSTCHRLEDVGVEVGPDLLSALRNKTREGLLIDILDPSREVDPRYINYQVSTVTGRVFSGMIASETASSLTLRRAEKAEDTVLRSQIDTIEATAKSVMPDGLEMQLSKQDVADVIAYLQSVASPK